MHARVGIGTVGALTRFSVVDVVEIKMGDAAA